VEDPFVPRLCGAIAQLDVIDRPALHRERERGIRNLSSNTNRLTRVSHSL
jgi:hypothetical protein